MTRITQGVQFQQRIHAFLSPRFGISSSNTGEKPVFEVCIVLWLLQTGGSKKQPRCCWFFSFRKHVCGCRKKILHLLLWERSFSDVPQQLMCYKYICLWVSSHSVYCYHSTWSVMSGRIQKRILLMRTSQSSSYTLSKGAVVNTLLWSVK